MPERTRTETDQLAICAHLPCGRRFQPRKPTQRFCSGKCRAAAHREKQEQGRAARLVAGPRRVRGGWSYTVHLPELAPYEVGDELRILEAPPEVDTLDGST